MKIKADDLKDWGKALRRELLDEVDSSIERLSRGKGQFSEESVHEVRKSLKRVRAGLKLLRGAKGMKEVARKANRLFRDAGRPLSEVRDAKVMVETVGNLMKHFGERLDAGVGKRLASALSRRRGKVRGKVFEKGHARGSVLRAVRAGSKAMSGWKPGEVGAEELIAAVAEAYRKARKAFTAAEENGEVEALHEARKRVKDFRYAVEICVEVYPNLKVMAEASHKVTDALGVDHDLVVLREVVGDLNLKSDEKALVLALIKEWQSELMSKAREIAVGLFAETAGAFRTRLLAVDGGMRALRKGENPTEE